MNTVAIMQPYFMPYAGYFRLFCATDLVVFHETTAFNHKRGYVHRNQLPNYQNLSQWFTLPTEKASHKTPIYKILFHSDAQSQIEKQFRRFPSLSHPRFHSSNEIWKASIRNVANQNLSSYNIRLLEEVCERLGLPFRVATTADLQLPTSLMGQDRVVAIAKHFQAKTYINPPGGRQLYDHETFKHHGMKLAFLSEYKGDYTSILHRLIIEDPSEIKQEILKNT
jgi:hypothetical protein